MPAPPRELPLPQTGTYVARFVKGGPAVAVKITIEHEEDGQWRMQAVVNGKPLGYAYTKDEIEAEVVIWLMGGRPQQQKTPAERLLMNILLASPVDEAEYGRLLELKRTAPEWHPCHRPYEKIDLSKLPPLGRGKRS